MRAALVTLALLAFSGCKERSSTPPPESTAAVLEPEDAGRIEPLTVSQLDGYLAYRKAMTEAHKKLAPLMDQLEAKARKMRDGGVAEAGLNLIRQEAKAQETALAASGLSPAQLQHIEEMVQAFVNERTLADDAAEGNTVQQMEALAAKLPAEQRGTFEASISELKALKEQSEKLPELRKSYGDADVAVLLQREQEVRRAWDEWLNALAGAKK